jgi:hypothetical protein
MMTDRWFSNTTQIYRASRALVQGQTLNRMDAIHGVKAWQLAQSTNGAKCAGLHKHPEHGGVYVGLHGRCVLRGVILKGGVAC